MAADQCDIDVWSDPAGQRWQAWCNTHNKGKAGSKQVVQSWIESHTSQN